MQWPRWPEDLPWKKIQGSQTCACRVGFQKSKTDPCVFRMVVDGKVELIMAVYVDDIVIAGSDEACRDFHAALNTNFPRIT